MPSRTMLTRRALVGSLLGLMLAGCGGEKQIEAVTSEERGLKELARIYRGFTTKNKRGPKTLKELKVKGQQYPIAVQMINSGDLVVQWGAPLSPEGATTEAILAYLKTAPEQGGLVLLQDGSTIKTMTADEFKAAPKAAGK